MLLTRSRLCPRPKPGSSLHLHVLSTPPAFVLSQDQTLREELLTEFVAHLTRARPYTWPAPDAFDEVLFRCRTCAPKSAAGIDEPGRTDHDSGARPESIGAHAVEFSKTAAPLGGGGSSARAHSGAVPSGQWSVARPASRVQAAELLQRRGTVSLAEPVIGASTGSRRRLTACARVALAAGQERGAGGDSRRARFAAGRARDAVPACRYETTCTCTSRRRGRSSKSISTSCCQVPRTRRPATSGTVSDGPTSDARRWEWALSSALTTLWA